MPTNLVRVELHHAVHSNSYEVLHRILAANNYRHVVSTDAGLFRLPPAEYMTDMPPNLTASDLCNHTRNLTTSATGLQCAVVVVELASPSSFAVPGLEAVR